MSIAKRTENNCEFILAKSWKAKMNPRKRSETELWEVDANPRSSKWLNGPQALKYMKISQILDRQNFGYGFSLRKSPNIDVDKYQFNFWVSFFFSTDTWCQLKMYRCMKIIFWNNWKKYKFSGNNKFFKNKVYFSIMFHYYHFYFAIENFMIKNFLQFSKSFKVI